MFTRSQAQTQTKSAHSVEDKYDLFINRAMLRLENPDSIHSYNTRSKDSTPVAPRHVYLPTHQYYTRSQNVTPTQSGYSTPRVTRSSNLVCPDAPNSYNTRSRNEFIENDSITRSLDDEFIETVIARLENNSSPPQTHYTTRSSNIYDVNIDFNESSNEWTRNKRRTGPGDMYSYICGQTCNSGYPCKKSRYQDNEYCYLHCK